MLYNNNNKREPKKAVDGAEVCTSLGFRKVPDDRLRREKDKEDRVQSEVNNHCLTVLSVKPSALLSALLPFSSPYTLGLKAGMMDASVTL